MVGPLSYDGLSYLDRKDIIKAFKNTDAKIESGVFTTSDEIEIIVNDISVGFYSTESYLLNVPSSFLEQNIYSSCIFLLFLRDIEKKILSDSLL